MTTDVSLFYNLILTTINDKKARVNHAILQLPTAQLLLCTVFNTVQRRSEARKTVAVYAVLLSAYRVQQPQKFT